MLGSVFKDEPIPAVLYKYLAPRPHAFDVIKDMRVRFTQPSALNDPCECTIAVEPFAHQRFPGPPSIAAGIMMAELNSPEFRAQVDASIGVLALSMEAANPRLWALYAEEARGFCVGFRTSASMFVARGDPEFQATWTVQYHESPPRMPVRPGARIPNRDALPYMLRAKSLAWADEREVRVVRSLARGDLDDRFTDGNGFPVRRLRFAPDDVVEIVFGARSSTWTCQLVARDCEMNGMRPIFLRAWIPQGSYRLELEPFDPMEPF